MSFLESITSISHPIKKIVEWNFQTLMSRSGIKAPRRSVRNRGRGMRCGCCLSRAESRPFCISRGRPRRATAGNKPRNRRLTLPAASRRNPRALDVGRTIIATTLATSPAHPIIAVPLCFVPAIHTRPQATDTVLQIQRIPIIIFIV